MNTLFLFLAQVHTITHLPTEEIPERSFWEVAEPYHLDIILPILLLLIAGFITYFLFFYKPHYCTQCGYLKASKGTCPTCDISLQKADVSYKSGGGGTGGVGV